MLTVNKYSVVAVIALISRKFFPLFFFRILYNLGLTKIVSVLDPNWIRKHIKYKTGKKIVHIGADNWKLLVDFNDHIGYHTYVTQVPFEMGAFFLAKSLHMTSDDYILDIGANIGTATVPLCAETGAKLIAIEASMETAGLLIENIRINSIRASLHILALVDAKEDEFVKLYISRGNIGSNSIIKEWSQNKSNSSIEYEYTPSTTLDKLIEFEGIDLSKLKLVKIDVEGAEHHVLLGASTFLRLNNAPIMMEYRADAAVKLLSKEMADVANLLEGFNYKIYSFDNNIISSFDLYSSYENIVAIKKNSEAERILLRKQ